MENHKAVVLLIMRGDEGRDFAPMRWVDVGAVDGWIEGHRVGGDTCSVELRNVRSDLAKVYGNKRACVRVLHATDGSTGIDN